MAYADTNTTTRKLGTGAAVLLIEAGVAAALVTGLAMTGTIKPDTIIDTFDIPKPEVTPTPPPPDKPQVRRNESTIDRPDVLIKLPPVTDTLPEVELKPSGDNGKDTVGDVTFPQPEVTPDPPQPPRFTPKRAVPRGSTAKWVTTNDYPASELRAEHQGTTRYRLSIDAGGAVTDCTVTASSGYPGLDRAACETVKRRAKFEPATDHTGARAPGSFSGSVTWQIPKE